jgi:hypothetical protein
MDVVMDDIEKSTSMQDIIGDVLAIGLSASKELPLPVLERMMKQIEADSTSENVTPTGVVLEFPAPSFTVPLQLDRRTLLVNLVGKFSVADTTVREDFSARLMKLSDVSGNEPNASVPRMETLLTAVRYEPVHPEITELPDSERRFCFRNAVNANLRLLIPDDARRAELFREMIQNRDNAK